MQWQGPPIDKCQKLLSLLADATKPNIFMYISTRYLFLSLNQKKQEKMNFESCTALPYYPDPHISRWVPTSFLLFWHLLHELAVSILQFCCCVNFKRFWIWVTYTIIDFSINLFVFILLFHKAAPFLLKICKTYKKYMVHIVKVFFFADIQKQALSLGNKERKSPPTSGAAM